LSDEEDQVQMKPIAISSVSSAALQQKCLECEQEGQVQRSSNGTAEADSNLESQLNSSKGGGSPLSDEVRSFMEARFGADFSQVRTHTGSEAVQMNQELNAQAFTHKQDVYFGAGKAPSKDALTAHELTHVIQQMGAVQTKTISRQPAVQLKCSACENEEAEVQRSPNISPTSNPELQRWSLFGDDEDKQEAEGGGILDWAKEKASGAVDTVTQSGSDAYDWAKEKGGAAVDTVTQSGSDAYDWAKEKGSAAVDTVTQSGSDAYDWAKEKGEQYSSEFLEAKKASLLAQISQAMPKIAEHDFVYISSDQIATLNGHFAALHKKSQGLISLPEIAAQTDPTLSSDASSPTPVAASTIQSVLLNLQSSISAPFMFPDPESRASEPESSASESEAIQGRIQRALPLVIAGGAALSIWAILEIIAIAAIIVAAIVLIILMVSKYKEKQKAKEKEKEEAKKKECTQEYKNAITEEYHNLCDAGNSCSERLDNCASATAKVGRRQACVKMRTDFQQKCFNPGDPKYEEHMEQIANQSAGLANCIEVMHIVCGDRR
jgi:cell division protein FtsL